MVKISPDFLTVLYLLKQNMEPSVFKCALLTDFASEEVLEMALNGKTLIMAGSVLNVSILQGFIVPKGLPLTVTYSRRIDTLICRIKESEKMRKLMWNTGFQPSGRLKIMIRNVILLLCETVVT